MNLDKCLKCNSYIPPSDEKTELGSRYLQPAKGYKYPHRCDSLMCYEPEVTEHNKHIKYPKTYAEIISAFSPKKQ